MSKHTFFRKIALKLPYIGTIIQGKENLSKKIVNLQNEINNLQNDLGESIDACKEMQIDYNCEITKRNDQERKNLDEFTFEKERRQFQKVSYSQDGEDVVLASFYETKRHYQGFYIDIGAFHPHRFSNTQIFYERGWRGINIDATPGSMNLFNELRCGDINLVIGVAVDESELIFYQFEEPALNSFNKEISEERIADSWKLFRKKKINTKTINSILNDNLPKNTKLDFINIDVEGLDFEILRSLDWKMYAPEYLLVEALEIVDKDIIGFESDEMYKFLNKKGYEIVARTRRTLIFKKR